MSGSDAFAALFEPKRQPRSEEEDALRFVRDYEPIQFEEPPHHAGQRVRVKPRWLAQAFVDLGYAVRI